MDSTLLKLPEVSAMLGVPVNTLRYWRTCHQGPPSAKLGKRIVYRESDVRAWIDAQFAAGTDGAA